MRHWGRLEASVSFDMIIDTTHSHLSFLPVTREMTSFGRGEPASQVPETCWLSSTHQESSHSTGWAFCSLDCHLEFGNPESPLDLTADVKTSESDSSRSHILVLKESHSSPGQLSTLNKVQLCFLLAYLEVIFCIKAKDLVFCESRSQKD